jgi:phosphatidylserine decarboxylase
MVRDGIPFVLVPLGVAAVFGYFGLWWGAAPFVAVAGFMAYFFRDPRRVVPEGEGLIVSAADGRVTRIDERPDEKVVSVFL